jgi:hypothetical protein
MYLALQAHSTQLAFEGAIHRIFEVTYSAIIQLYILI